MSKLVNAMVFTAAAVICAPLYASSAPQTIDTEYVSKKKAEFELLDVANNGYITYEQASQLLPGIGDQIAKVDLNTDGKITWSEVEFMYRSFNDALGSRAQQQLQMLEKDKQ